MKNKSKKKRKILLVILFLIIILTVWYEKPVTEIISIRGKGKIDTPVRFALVTDLHSCYYGKDQKRLTDMIDKGKVDGILLSGDIFDDKFSDTNAKIFMEAISKKYPCFYVTGNHEFWSKRENETKEYLKSMGVTVLEGNASTIEIKGNKIDICGVDDPTYMKNDEWRSQLTKASEKSDPEHYRILLSHRPEKVDVYREYDFDLVVSGHAHGGQWKIPFLHMGTAAPNQGLFPKYVDGLYELGNGTEMIVSRGLARERMPYPRFFNHPEVVLIDIGK
ncbi:metallophosphoesterase [Butyrivibrio sp. X503]|uniref:metallophosphoesterase n=1 Tax=Butyrivibrio sp. X503 TaxID=2364878 RepID=UPI000EA902C3|nr:metallophosphoesterase [Butyrivibrio sp. X503]RKM55818.1 metallophosphoesterase [Butyrivibrio sp. X503]